MSKSIFFSDSLYRREAVENSVVVYQQLASFSLKNGENGVEVSVENILPEFENVLIDSFSNYVLNETIVLVRKEKGGDL